MSLRAEACDPGRKPADAAAAAAAAGVLAGVRTVSAGARSTVTPAWSAKTAPSVMNETCRALPGVAGVRGEAATDVCAATMSTERSNRSGATRRT
jgi:hypothetical protein